MELQIGDRLVDETGGGRSSARRTAQRAEGSSTRASRESGSPPVGKYEIGTLSSASAWCGRASRRASDDATATSSVVGLRLLLGDPGGCSRKEKGQPRWLGGAPLGIPNLEASNVKLEGSSAGRQSGPLHHQLIHRNNRLAGVALFPGARTTANPSNAATWQAPVLNLCLDENADSLRIHSGLTYGDDR